MIKYLLLIGMVLLTLELRSQEKSMIDYLIHIGLVSAPIQSLQQAKERYGPLDKEYRMTAQNKWIKKFDLNRFGLSSVLYVNKDMIIPLTFVMMELKVAGLLEEITEFQGCYSPRAVRNPRLPETVRPSIHSYGLACDFNHTQFSTEFVAVWKKYGFCWGGDFKRWKDYMHFSYGYEC